MIHLIWDDNFTFSIGINRIAYLGFFVLQAQNNIESCMHEDNEVTIAFSFWIDMRHECHLVLEHWIRVEIYVESSKLRQSDPF